MKKILILTSNPRNDLKLTREIKDLKNVIKRAKKQSQFEAEFELEVYPEELQDLLLEHEPRIVHFCGHGTGKQGLVFQNLAGQERVISTEALSSLFELFDKSCECVVLNACYSEVQADAIVRYINYAIGMKQEIKDDAAIAFATGFYRALGWGKSIEEAYKFGRNAIQIQIAEDNNSRSRSSGENRKMVAVDVVERIILPEDLKPVLKIKSPLTPFPSKVASFPVENSNPPTQPEFPPELIAALQEEKLYKEYRDRARETWDEFGQFQLIQREAISQNEYHQRKTLLDKVRDFWIDGFLKPSLHANAAIDLDWRNNPDAVLNPLEGIKDLPVELDKSFEELQTTDILNQTGEGKTLLILGEPGAGKTIALLQLTEKLVNQTERDLTKPIPVVFNLSSWEQKQQTIEQWLIEEFKDKYQVPQMWSKPWLEQEQLILLLDGLDEVRENQRNACVKALNQFIATHNITEMVVCSRVKDYQALTERLQLSSALCIKPLSKQQVYGFLTKAGDSLAGIKTLLQQDREFEQFAQTPLILNVMSMAYQNWSAEKLLQEFRTSQDRYRHLFDTYIERMLNHRAIDPSKPDKNYIYPQEKVLHWLSWLAKTMVDESKIIFLIEKMQPTLLKSRRENFSYWISNFILGGLSVGLILWLIKELIFGFIVGLKISQRMRMLTRVVAFSFIGGTIAGLSREITLFEQMSWSWQRAKSRIIFQIFLGLILGQIYGLSFVTIARQISWIRDPFGRLIGLGLVGVIIGAINSGLSSTKVVQRTIANQGINSSRKNSVRIGLIGLRIGGLMGVLIMLMGGLMGGLDNLVIGGLIKGLIGEDIFRRSVTFIVGELDIPLIKRLVGGLIFGSIFGLSVGLILAMLNGGATCIKHFNLRLILHRKNCIPWNYARFLDYASERLLMKKVGGGYIFYHRMLMEHFAQRHQVSKNPISIAARQTPESVAQTSAKTSVSSSNTSNNISLSLTTEPTAQTNQNPEHISQTTIASVTSLNRPVLDPITCGSCNHQNPGTGKFCIKCGKQLSIPTKNISNNVSSSSTTILTPEPVTQPNSNSEVTSKTIIPANNLVPDSIICISCNQHNPNNGKFCIKCGRQLINPLDTSEN